MLRRHAALTVIMVILASFFVWAGTAVAHEGEVVSADCSSVSGSFVDFAADDHPISFAVSIAGGPFQTVAAVESPPGFVGAGTASADISSLTATLEGKTGTLAVYAFWDHGQTDAAQYTVTCGDAPPPTTVPPTTVPPTTTTTTPPPPMLEPLGPPSPPPPPPVAVQTAPLTTG
jgi:hypothetical protein